MKKHAQKTTRRLLSALGPLLAAAVILAGCGRRENRIESSPAVSSSPESLVAEIIRSYPRGGKAAAEKPLSALAEMDPRQGVLWGKILNFWNYVNSDLPADDRFPEGLPTDDSLCLVVMGYQLASDGSMQDELVQRCQTALKGAEAYPRAMVLVTGGPTAFSSRATEAGEMARWLREHGIDEERILVEDRAMTSADNASLGASLLRERAPQVRELVIVSSDYHVPLGCLLFFAQAQKEALETGREPFSISAGVGCPVPEKAGTQGPSVQAVFLRELFR